MKHVLTVVTAASLIVVGCKEKAPPAPQPAGSATTGHDDHDGHDHHDGAVVELGSTTIGPYTVRASRDEGELKPGGEAAIDVWVSGDGPKVAAVRFWIGTQDGAGSLKAKADIEDPKEPSRWHTHAEVPEPLPAGSELWVEIEDDSGAKSAGSFSLKA